MRVILDTNVLLAALISPHRPRHHLPYLASGALRPGNRGAAVGRVAARPGGNASGLPSSALPGVAAVPCRVLPQWRVCETIPAEIGPLLPRRPWPGCRSPLTVSKEAKVSLRRKTIFAHIRIHEALGPIPPVECRVTQFPGFCFWVVQKFELASIGVAHPLASSRQSGHREKVVPWQRNHANPGDRNRSLKPCC